jgi:hypothetical protein
MPSPISEASSELLPIDRRLKVAEILVLGLIRACRGTSRSGFTNFSESRADGLEFVSEPRLSVSHAAAEPQDQRRRPGNECLSGICRTPPFGFDLNATNRLPMCID